MFPPTHEEYETSGFCKRSISFLMDFVANWYQDSGDGHSRPEANSYDKYYCAADLTLKRSIKMQILLST